MTDEPGSPADWPTAADDIAHSVNVMAKQAPTASRTAVLRLAPHTADLLRSACSREGVELEDEVTAIARRFGFADGRVELFDDHFDTA